MSEQKEPKMIEFELPLRIGVAAVDRAAAQRAIRNFLTRAVQDEQAMQMLLERVQRYVPYGMN